MNIIENRADISGEIMAISTDPTNAGFVTLQLKIISTSDHAPFPNLVKPGKDGRITLKIKDLPQEQKALKKGDQINATIRATPGDIYFAQPGTVVLS